MRLLRLELEGFGVYDEPLKLDFAKLPLNCLFLVHGPTGGGKSMLLDGICFALFDEAATRERSGAALRSDHAKPERATRVVLEFALRGKVYRLQRSPAYERPAQRGGGLVAQPARVEFHRLAGEESGADAVELLGNRKKEVDQRIIDTLGIDGEQFRQLVVIPQGRFREILTAGSRDREQMMASLFQTERLARLQSFMKSRANELQATIRAGRERREAVLQGLGVQSEHELVPAIEQAAHELERVAQSVAAATTAALQARQALERTKDRNQKLARLEQTRSAVAAREIEAPMQRDRLEALQQARKLQSLEPLFARVTEAGAFLERQDRELADLARKLVLARDRIADADRSREKLTGEALALLRQIEDRSKGDSKAVETAGENLRQAELLWRAGRAGHLARQLKPGEPCPVCGSSEHPVPAPVDDSTPDDAAIERLRHLLDEARARFRAAERGIDRFREALQTLAVDFDAELLSAPALTPERMIQALRQQATDAETLRNNEAKLAQAHSLTQQQVEAAVKSVKQSRNALTDAVTAAGFATIDEAQKLRLDATAMAKLEAVIEAFGRREIEAQTRLATALEEAPEGEMIDPVPFEVSAKQTEAARDTALREEEAARIRHRRLLEGREALALLARQIDELDARYAVEGRIAALANGEGGTERITFQRFVLATLLDEALDAASQRLRLMSRNRYILRRALASADRRQVAGLDLEVDDAYTGRSRPVGTLSGGESFLASLALALGMADVIARHAGGIRLETMFIDEGFGSLDPEALDLAMRTLIDLRREGRTIGIVSHVPELRERIDYRLEVKATARGSHAAFVLP